MKPTKSNLLKKFLTLGFLTGMTASMSCTQAAIVGPYSLDSATLHLWHMDQATVPVLDSAAGGTNLIGLQGGATLGSPSFTGFGNALNTVDGGQDGTAAGTRDALLSPSTASPPGNVAITYADATTGAFTIEAIVWIGFDPTRNLGTVANGGNGRSSPLEIVSAESGANPGRIFQFRIIPVGMVPIGTAPATVPLLTFENIRAVSGNQATIYAAIPTTGPDAIITNNWYHVAVTYNGSPNTANNIKFYWTLMDPSRTSANQISITSAQTTLSGMNPLSATSTPLVIGNEARNRSGNFLGAIDEVRISKVERTAVGMQFTPANVTILTQPASQFVAVGDTLTLSTVAGGGAPISYQWQFNGNNLPNATNTSLMITNVTASQAGNYQVIVSNPNSSATSATANVRVGQLFSELFNTGLADNRSLLPGGATDPHWQLVQSDDPVFPGPAAIVDSSLPGVWLVNGPSSLWISPGDGANNAAGLYTYRTSFLIDTMDPNNAQLSGSWVSDNQGVDVRLNGVSLGLTNATSLGSFSFFTITNGFVAGSNTLECVVSNSVGAGINLSGLRAEVRGVALPLSATPLTLVSSPANVSTQAQQSVSFSVVATGSGPITYQWFFGASPLSGQTNRTLVLNRLTTAQSGNYKVVVANGVSSTNATATLTVTTPPSLAWLGLNSADWDTATINWLDTGSSANVLFSPNDDVLFDNNGSGAPVVNLTAPLQPNSVVVNASSDYTFTSATGGGIAGPVNLTKQGSGTLVLDTVNTYSGTTLIQGGTLQVGNADSSGTLGSSMVSNNAALVFNRLDSLTVPNPIAGTGSVTMAGSGGLVLTGSNSYTGPTVISSGVVSVRRTTALGTGDAGTTVAAGAQLFLDVNIDIANEPLILNGTGPAGDGALRKGGGGVTTFSGPITLASYSGIKLDGNTTLNLTNSAGITSADINLGFAGDSGSRGTVSGPITLGAGAVSEFGSGTWVLAGTNNTWTGGTTITGGTLQIGDGGNNGSIGNGPIEVDTTLTFFSSNNITVNSTIIGGGALNQIGNGTLFLTGVNSYTGPTRITGTGALRPGNSQAMGGGTITIGGSQTDTSRLELTGDIMLLNTITIFPRAFGVLDNPADIVNVSGTNVINAPTSIVIPGGGNLLTFESDSGLLVVSNGVTAGGVGRFLVLKGAAAGQIYGTIDQTAGNSQNLYKLDAGTWTLFGQDTSSGTTTVSNGTLVINGSLGTNLTTVAGGALGGTGVILGPVVVTTGGTLAPGTSIGTLMVSNSLTLQPGSFTSMEINKSAGLSDAVVGLTSATYGGTLVVSNLSGTLAIGDSFKLFDALTYSGTFASILPAIPGSGLAWNTNTLATDGTLRVAANTAPQSPKFTSITFSGGNQLVFSGTNGSASAQFTILSSANVAAPLSTWVPVSTNSFNGSGNFTVTNTINPAAGSRFYTIRVP
ncbi:beta strand repeat-containing protein [Pedosphaera parvula]|uniref:Autotransporter-associated beta strand repeat protein n=1 Tax=Pedosphaera parvula (strain Ellin514) TaxID=320771 RepID=B9XCZ2_PEDPL|nr:autotransporter-associated beta strand repeat-containing protein [Pedosphaera parvula]EEF62338.1 autotransporter-associated beta strand repeat protein [Pedosphaera parvula Ellin514]